MAEAGIVYEGAPVLGGLDPAPRATLVAELPKAAASELRTALMCSEGKYTDCHRHYLLVPVLLELGWTIIQINRDGSATTDTGPNRATLKRFGQAVPEDLQCSLF
jgi:hypothetical protein